MSNPNDSFSKTMLVVVASCLVCALVVSVAAVSLRPRQLEQRALDKQRNILAAAGIAAPEGRIPEVYHKYIDAKVIDLATGNFVDEVDPNTFDQRKAVKLKEFAQPVPPEVDIAGVRAISRLASVYIAHDDAGAVSTYVIPIHGQGLWSTMYAFLAIQPDGVTAKSVVYYDQGETPGLGGEVVNPLWIAQWDGKKLFNDQGEVALTVLKSTADPSDPNFAYQIDGLAGATLTSKGVHNSFVFWLGEYGFGPFLAKLRQGANNHG
ncbi:MAG: Na(+)-translocating NADH-quinone reductase subunit C [Gammaproteobacteria bacterium]|nr:Na(+)-translocating NADH-quinone reductase subunit C [Gammaproteobacteria bacterium]